jgi:hypothetical protein
MLLLTQNMTFGPAGAGGGLAPAGPPGAGAHAREDQAFGSAFAGFLQPVDGQVAFRSGALKKKGL